MSLIAVAVSGGIDSLAAAYLLKKAGHPLIGLHFVTGYEADPAGSEQTAQSLSSSLGIPVEIVDLRNTFSEKVVSYFTRTYLEGRTPNPCMVCNEAVKFGKLLDVALNFGATRLATGHYARLQVADDGTMRLKKGADPVKDQSYFLARLNQRQLSQALFPLGHMKKEEIVSLCRVEGIAPAAASESQDVCFVHHPSYMDFIMDQGIPLDAPGAVVDTEGNVIGKHSGLFRYTVGQRRGIGIPGPEPYYVLRIDPSTHRLVVGKKTELLSDGCLLSGMNWILPRPTESFRAEVRLRYRHRAVSATILPVDEDRALVRFDAPQAAVTPGQGGVIYDGESVLGSGWIEPLENI
jgi:tRNA-uridine 2-sulfurtransferase